MHEPDLKKLITGFLVLAVISTTGALILSRNFTTNANTQPQSAAFSLKNAFLPGGLPNLDSGVATNQNLTQNLADNLAQKILDQNPNGPTNTSGTIGINQPELENTISDYIASVNIPTSSIAFFVDESKIKILREYSQEDIRKYLNSIVTILNESSGGQLDILSSELQDPNQDSVSVETGQLFFSKIETEIYGLSVPEPFLEFHKKLLRAIEIPRVVFNQNVDSDPLQAWFVLQSAQQAIGASEVDLLAEIQYLNFSLPSQLKTLGLTNSKNFFIPTAYAGIPVFDYLKYALGLLQHALQKLQAYYAKVDSFLKQHEYLDRIFTEKFKDQLLKMLGNAILAWATGRGGISPSFVSDWSSFLKDSYVNAANIAISDATAGICDPFRTQIQLQLYSLYGESSVRSVLRSPTLSDLQSCSLQQTVGNLDAFYGDFNQGGWAGYLALTDFGGNPYGSLYMAAQQVGQAAQQKQAADKAAAQAGSGYTGTYSCEDKSVPIEGYCANGKPATITTPGKNIADSVSKTLTSAFDRITSANDWKNLAAGVAQSVILKIVSAGTNGLLYVNAGNANQPPNSGNDYSVCSAYDPNSAEYANCKQQVDSMNNAGNNDTTVRDLVLTQAQQALGDAQAALNSAQLDMNAASSTIQVLNSVASSSSQCPSEAVTAQNELTGLNLEYADLVAKASTLTTQISDLNSFIDELNNHQPANDADFYNQEASKFQSQFGDVANFSDLRGELDSKGTDLQDKLTQASALLQQCLAH